MRRGARGEGGLEEVVSRVGEPALEMVGKNRKEVRERRERMVEKCMWASMVRGGAGEGSGKDGNWREIGRAHV